MQLRRMPPHMIPTTWTAVLPLVGRLPRSFPCQHGFYAYIINMHSINSVCVAAMQLELADGRTLTCRLVVAADGAASRLRQLAGLRTWGWQYGQRGLVATVTTDGARHGQLQPASACKLANMQPPQL